ncbi:MAG: dihydrodipicolinate synthase family protein [Anaerolineae bacterium]|nr:dihydrodipicolinate synthase family protein [Anaerolineae bacterium]
MFSERLAQLKWKVSFGVSPAMATPLKGDGNHLNAAALPALVNFLIGKGVKGLFVGGTTGEGVLLPAAARMELHEKTVQAVSGRVPVLLHVGANNTDEAIALAQHAAALQAEAIVAMTPYFYPLQDEAMVSYFQLVAAAAPDTPFFVYDIPQQAINGITPAIVPHLLAAIPTLAGMKTSRGDVNAVRQLIEVSPEQLIILAGNEAVALGMLALGAHGLISGLSTAIPEPYVALTQAVERNDLAAARHHQEQINRLLKTLPAGVRLGAIKTILQQRGIPVGPPMPPRPPAPAGWNGWELAQAVLQAPART